MTEPLLYLALIVGVLFGVAVMLRRMWGPRALWIFLGVVASIIVALFGFCWFVLAQHDAEVEASARRDAAQIVPIFYSAHSRGSDEARFKSFVSTRYPPGTPIVRLRHDFEVSGFACGMLPNPPDAPVLRCDKSGGASMIIEERWFVVVTLSADGQTATEVEPFYGTIAP